MDLLAEIKKSFPHTATLHHTIGKDDINGGLSCGFIRKPDKSANDVDIVFHHYGALLLLDGQGIYADHDGTEIKLTPGCYIQRLPDRKHSTIIEPDGRWLEVFVCFGRDLYGCLERLGIINSQRPVLNPGLDYTLLHKFHTLFLQMKEAKVGQLPSLLANAQEIAFLAHELDEKKAVVGKSTVIEEANRLMDENIGKETTAHEIAEMLNLGYESFRKLFKEKTGLSPTNFMIQKRINAAKSLLLSQIKSIREIAYELGYSDPFAFSKQFKKVVGKSPEAFRRQF